MSSKRSSGASRQILSASRFGEIYKNKVKLTFFQGASLEDPAGLFNSSLEGKTRRAIDLHKGDDTDGEAFKALVRSAAQLNAS